MNFFGGSSFFEKITNPAGALHSSQYEKDRKAAEAQTAAAQAQEAAYKAELKARQEALILQAQKTALEASQGTYSNVADVQSGGGVDSATPLATKRKRGADSNITVGI